jgi:hypothetical protein
MKPMTPESAATANVLILLWLSSIGSMFSETPAPTASPNPSSLSPDKKWEYVGGDPPKLVKAGTTQAVLELPGGVLASETKVVWAPDSKRFAFNYRAGSRYNTTALYQLRGDKWVALRSPETEETSKPLERVKAAQLRKLGLPPKTYRQKFGDITRVREWVGPDSAILYCSSSAAVRSKKDSDEKNYLEAAFLFTLKFDAEGNWKIVKTHQMSEKEIEKEAEEQ